MTEYEQRYPCFAPKLSENSPYSNIYYKYMAILNHLEVGDLESAMRKYHYLNRAPSAVYSALQHYSCTISCRKIPKRTWKKFRERLFESWYSTQRKV